MRIAKQCTGRWIPLMTMIVAGWLWARPSILEAQIIRMDVKWRSGYADWLVGFYRRQRLYRDKRSHEHLRENQRSFGVSRDFSCVLMRGVSIRQLKSELSKRGHSVGIRKLDR